ncbi:MAG: protein kinase [Myxococcales bacterium]|nr:protein kinase [Myxococcales bacterium]
MRARSYRLFSEELMAHRDLSGRTLGEFVLREKIAEGGYGEVYRCDQPLLERSVVVKVLHDTRWRGHGAQERFLREAQLASRLDHPYAAHVYAFGLEGGIGDEEALLWIAMELVQGITLERWLKTHGPMPLDQFVPYFERVADVVHTAHERGIIHRDLKPSNMMVIERGGRLFPKLLDFGIAKVCTDVAATEPGDTTDAPSDSVAELPERTGSPGRDDIITARIRATPSNVQRTRTSTKSSPPQVHRDLTRPGAAIGSFPYMSPEQWSNARNVGPASDVYSLGVVVYQALTGRLPFSAPNTQELHDKHLHAEVPLLGADLPPELHRIVARALAKSSKDRHTSVLELAAELRSVLRASDREQLKASAQQWEDRGRPPGLLWGQDVLADVARRASRVPSRALTGLECSFVAESQGRARRLRWFHRALVALVAVGALGVLRYRTAIETRVLEERAQAAETLTQKIITQSELERGQSALLHGEPEAAHRLWLAYQRGERSAGILFMLARALQSTLSELARFQSTSGQMWSAAFSPDGRQIVTTDDRNAQLRDATTGQLLHTLPHGDSVYDAAFSPDGSKLVTAGGDGIVRIWDTASGSLVRELRCGTAKPRYYALALSPDGKLVAAIAIKGDVTHAWDFASGEPIAEIRNDDTLGFAALAFSADGRWLATTGGNVVHVYDTLHRAQAVSLSEGGIHRLAFDPTGPRLVTGSSTGDAWIWAIPSGKKLHHLRDIGDPVDAVAFSPDGQLVAAGCRDGAELIWHARTGQLQSQLNPRRSRILSVEFDRTSKLLLAAGTDGAVVVVDTAQGMPITALEGPQKVVRVAHFDPSGRRIVGASSDGTARVWDATPPYRRSGSLPVSDHCGVASTAEPAGRFLAISCGDTPTQVWDTVRDQLLAELPSVSRVEGDFFSPFPAVSRAGDRAAIARGHAVEVYELPGGRLLRTITHSAAVNAVGFAGTGRDIVSGAVDGSLVVTRDNGAMLTLPRATGGIDAVAFANGGRVIAADAQRRLRVYDAAGTILADLQMPMRVISLRIDGAQLVTVPMVLFSTTEASPLLVDLEKYRVITQLTGHRGRVFSARWVAGHQIMTAGGDGTARLWDGATGQLLHTYDGGSRYLADATLVSDGLVLAGGADGMMRFWDRASERLLWTLPAHRSAVVGIHVEGNDIVTRGFTGEISRWRLPDAEHVIRACEDQRHCGIVQP